MVLVKVSQSSSITRVVIVGSSGKKVKLVGEGVLQKLLEHSWCLISGFKRAALPWWFKTYASNIHLALWLLPAMRFASEHITW